jgi:hypothetical protein
MEVVMKIEKYVMTGHVIKTVIAEVHISYRLPARTGHDQLYDRALSLLESKEEEEEKLCVRKFNEDGT